MKIYLFLFLLIALPVYTQPVDSLKSKVIKISGYVKGEKDKPIEGANLVIEKSIDGSTSDNTGFFEFETSKSGSQILLITALDYTERKELIEIKNQDIQINIHLVKTNVITDEIVVTASSFTSGQNSQVTLTPLEIVRIPGADADLYRAITTFPGSNQVDEGSRISVRGGDPNEVLTIFDQASLYNPFIFDDSYNMSSFSTINPWGLRGINFSSGGFSSKYGNVLSAILDLKSYDMPQSRGLFAVVGLANASLSGVYVNRKNTFGATFDASQTFLQPFFLVNPKNGDYSPYPSSTVVGGTLSYKVSPTSMLKLYANYSSDNIGVKSSDPNYEGYFSNKTNNYFTNLVFSTAPSSVSYLSLSASFSSFDKHFNFGIVDNSTRDLYAKLRADYSIPLVSKISFNAGAEYEYSGYNTDGVFPVYFYNIRPDAESFKINSNNNTSRFGAYAESEFKFIKDIYFITGLRTDYHSLSQKAVVDPRFSVVYRLSEHSFLKGATGIYHQFTSLNNYMLSRNASLNPERAIHYILGYEYNRENDYIFRIESYYKDYKNLVSSSEYGYLYGSDGEGFARGVDVFFKVRFRPKFTGWISYAYTDSKRNSSPGQPLLSANYDITHSLSVVTSYNISDYFTVGASYKMSTGKPYTPVSGSIFDSTQNAYIPFYANFNSDRFSAYHRIDLNAQYIFSMFGKFTVVFFALNNILNSDNLYAYTYNFDYSKKIPVYSSNSRMIYFGIALQL
jgi:vitamin B12 transporter